ncbi:uncharacterized protein BT62DRAFT_1014385 [Guyanagaster necrorhizus]|uniref:Uncharacterized protein n=1 Tax=Guyanagaster necrorhizus TaxID=856835 RepID=A0A9P7VEK5_9AGAR|nr:uncharacterized protein BT62DRAFT_1014379 [Guyanagaster necrorhizus MCA 3950]XP_043032609.1 uncharacterized protein BT62DRAFT_1014385 [Guyanagaster necrorhizus MCA 3950]KAG7439100.1 hypothetical protein BT62DRAFT_1014379 [Guyanagaster necrorhizus MCA 3950]KAG7439105.1 hypothetical protein BT62DRAFT_1014385 [Guyanagaster necrorhizus MCA 3950]
MSSVDIFDRHSFVTAYRPGHQRADHSSQCSLRLLHIDNSDMNTQFRSILASTPELVQLEFCFTKWSPSMAQGLTTFILQDLPYITDHWDARFDQEDHLRIYV